MVLMVKNPLANAGNVKDVGLIPGSGRCTGVGNGFPLPVFLPGKFHGQRSLVDYSPCARKELGMTKQSNLILAYHTSLPECQQNFISYC